MSNFTFLPPVFKGLAEASRKAEEQITGDPAPRVSTPSRIAPFAENFD